MVTKLPKTGLNAAGQPYLYLTEWRDSRGLSVIQVAARIGVARQTVDRWEKEQWRLSPDTIAAYAEALGSPRVLPEMLWRPPSKAPSIDAILANQPEDLKKTAADIVRRLVRKD